MAIGFINGEWIPVDQAVLPIDERGHNFGDGVYEVIRVYQGTPFKMREHLVRLEKSAEAILLTMNYSIDELEALIAEGLAKTGLQEASVYLQVTRGIAKRVHLFPDVPASTTMTIRPATDLPATVREKGVQVTLVEDERWKNCYIKSLNLLPNVVAKQKATDAGFYEAVFVRDGIVLEGSSCNVFLIKDGVLITPPANRFILHGITRATLLEIAKEIGVPMEEKEFGPDELLAADEAFLSSTSMEVLPIVEIDGKQIGAGIPGTISRDLHKNYRAKYQGIGV
ncbi:D-amino-acid transaminase [Tumebacillus algifaecis]|uniref:D-alanine aminotransferase n=1 Tax=Tumebacillus algifaecis TaxID=1214604 RepID=A0A223CZX6_9BACL|nr:D-amino-acid transaminase [Tumebacillus algifaecis]ASS74703.1 D-amino-acid transaminase [Tumebacillus algifaecis]